MFEYKTMKTLRTIISTNHSTLCGLTCEILYSDQYTAIMLDKESRDTYTTPLDYRKKLKPLCERGIQEMLKRTCNILVHLKIPMLRFCYVCTENVLQ